MTIKTIQPTIFGRERECKQQYKNLNKMQNIFHVNRCNEPKLTRIQYNPVHKKDTTETIILIFCLDIFLFKLCVCKA